MLQILVTDVSTNYGKLLVCFGRILLTVLATRTMSIFSHGNSQNEPFKRTPKTTIITKMRTILIMILKLKHTIFIEKVRSFV